MSPCWQLIAYSVGRNHGTVFREVKSSFKRYRLRPHVDLNLVSLCGNWLFNPVLHVGQVISILQHQLIPGKAATGRYCVRPGKILIEVDQRDRRTQQSSAMNIQVTRHGHLNLVEAPMSCVREVRVRQESAPALLGQLATNTPRVTGKAHIREISL